MEVNKTIKTIEKDEFEIECKSCGEVIKGSTKNHAIYNFGLHKNGKKCAKLTLEKRIRDALPPTDPNYVSSKSNKATTEVKE